MAGAAEIERATRRLMAAAAALRRLAVDVPDGAPSNCIVWAVAQHARHGGSIVLTDSEYGTWFHARWRRRDGRVFEFAPTVPKAEVLAAYQGTMPTLFAGQPVEVAIETGPMPDSVRVLRRFVPGFHDY